MALWEDYLPSSSMLSNRFLIASVAPSICAFSNSHALWFFCTTQFKQGALLFRRDGYTAR